MLLLGLMVYLNNRIEKSSADEQEKTESTIKLDANQVGIAPMMAQLPDKAEGSLPIKLISNLNSNFLYFVNSGYEYKNEFTYTMLKKRYVRYVDRIQYRKLISYMLSARNKDIM